MALITLVLAGCGRGVRAGAPDAGISVLEEMELVSVMAHVAGFREYNTGFADEYDQAIDTWFAPYTTHRSIRYLQSLRDRFKVSHDAFASLAIHLEVKSGTLSWCSDLTHLGDRWKDVDKSELLQMLNAFYRDSRFHDFFVSHQSFYNSILSSYGPEMLHDVDTAWYSRFYGTHGQRFTVVMAFANGHHNYGPMRALNHSSTENFAVAGYVSCRYLAANNVTVASLYGPMLIHEFNHSYVNHLLRRPDYLSSMRPVGETMFSTTRHMMERLQYGRWDIVVNESIVRAATICYMENHGATPDEVSRLIQEEERLGLRWMGDLVESLRRYEQSRDRYPTFEDYYPEVIRALRLYLHMEY